jgi:acetyl-CoA carboxylase biotin carboxyl carrier protein
MDMRELRDLIQEILRSDIVEFELEDTGTRIKLRRGLRETETGVRTPAVPVAEVADPAATPAIALDAVIAAHASASVDANGLHFISSPIVGTFYRAPTPGAEPFVRPGSTVEDGTTLCIVEAMKLMNEIPCDIAGEIVDVYVDNGQPVEYGQKLFSVRPRR